MPSNPNLRFAVPYAARAISRMADGSPLKTDRGPSILAESMKMDMGAIWFGASGGGRSWVGTLAGRFVMFP